MASLSFPAAPIPLAPAAAPAAPPASSSSSSLSTPSTQLPSSPAGLQRYLHHRHLSTLRSLFELKTISYAQQQQQDQLQRQLKRQRSRANQGAAGGRGSRSRRNSSPAPSVATTEQEDQQQDQDLLLKLRLANASNSSEAKTGIDPAHAYDLLFDLTPSGASDAYYHGPHPPPPAKVVRTVLRAVRQAPFFDPNGVSVEALDSAAQEGWATEGAGQEGGAETEEWEQQMMASFSGACAERIGMGLAKLPPTQRGREGVQAQLQVQREREAAQAQAQASAQAQAQAQAAQQQAQAQQQASHGMGAGGYDGYGQQPFWKGMY